MSHPAWQDGGDTKSGVAVGDERVRWCCKHRKGTVEAGGDGSDGGETEEG